MRDWSNYPALLTAGQVAEILGLSPETVRRMFREDTAPVPVVQVRQRRYVKTSDLKAFLQSDRGVHHGPQNPAD